MPVRLIRGDCLVEMAKLDAERIMHQQAILRALAEWREEILRNLAVINAALTLLRPLKED